MPIDFLPRADEIPLIRIADAVGRRVNENILFIVDGGLGDRICAEPTLRYALEQFAEVDFSIATPVPELFAHLKFKDVYSSLDEPPRGVYLMLETYAYRNRLANQFFNANMMHGVDFASISALRCQLPDAYRAPRLEVPPSRAKVKCPLFTGDLTRLALSPKYVVLHAGDTWASRTLPAEFLNKMIWLLNKAGFTAVIVGICETRQRLDPAGVAIDLRNALNLKDFLWLCKHAQHVVTNDSAPLHIAATGLGRIAYIPTVRPPEFLEHHRGPRAQKGWNMKAFYSLPMWPIFRSLPNVLEELSAREVPAGGIEDYLPNPEEIVTWMIKGN